jgi:transcription initiation factor TFIID TATA-box-binding protein
LGKKLGCIIVKYQIVNLVASANLNATLDLYNLAISIPNIEYEPEQFPGAILKLKEPKVSMLLFKNGKVICSGASNEGEIELGIKKASKLIHEIQPSVKVLQSVEYQVVNLVATANLNQMLDLFQTALKLDNVEYEPEQFPGAILRINDPKITLLLFKNGKVICAGAKKEEYLRKGLKKAADLISAINKGKKIPVEEEEIEAEPMKPRVAEPEEDLEEEEDEEPLPIPTKKPVAMVAAKPAKTKVSKAAKPTKKKAAKPKAKAKKKK